MTSIQDSTISDLDEYLRLKKIQQAGERQGDSGKRGHRLLVPERPRQCLECQAEDCFWVKDYRFRWVVEGDLEEAIPVPRYICKYCNFLVSVLFSFLVPFRQFTKSKIGEAVEQYLLVETSYRDVAGEVSGNSDVMQRPNHSQVWRWVKLAADRAASSINVVLQRACVKAGKESRLEEAHAVVCPNSRKANTVEKTKNLNTGTRMLALAQILLEPLGHLASTLQAYFVDYVKPPLSILTGGGITLLTPQSSHRLKT